MGQIFAVFKAFGQLVGLLKALDRLRNRLPK
jgi:hypothetical protein